MVNHENTNKIFSEKMNILFKEANTLIIKRMEQSEILYSGITKLNEMLFELTNNSQKYRFITRKTNEILEYETLEDFIKISELSKYMDIFQMFSKIIKELNDETDFLQEKIILNAQMKITKQIFNNKKPILMNNSSSSSPALKSRSWADIAEEEDLKNTLNNKYW